MSQPLGNPVHKSTISVTSTPASVQVLSGLQSIEFVNMGSTDCYYGGSGVGSDTGAPIFSNGGRRTFENIPSNWIIYFVTAAGQTTTLRRIDYA